MVVWYYDNGLHVLQQVGSFFNDFHGGLSSAPKTKYVNVDASHINGKGHYHPFAGSLECKHVTKRVFLQVILPSEPGTEQTVSYGRKFTVTPEGLGLWKHHTVCVCVYVCVCVCLCLENARDRSEYGSIFYPSQTVP